MSSCSLRTQPSPEHGIRKKTEHGIRKKNPYRRSTRSRGKKDRFGKRRQVVYTNKREVTVDGVTATFNRRDLQKAFNGTGYAGMEQQCVAPGQTGEWEFVLEEDVAGDETLCLGCAKMEGEIDASDPEGSPVSEDSPVESSDMDSDRAVDGFQWQ